MGSFNSMWTKNFQIFKLDLEKAEEPEIKLPTSAGSSKKHQSSRKTPTSAIWTMASLWLCGYNKLWKILQEMGILDHLTYLLGNLYAGQKAAVGTGHGTTDWFQIGIVQGCILSPCLFKLHTECVMWNAGLDERTKIAGRNINNLRYADDTTLMAENEEELKSLWWKWKRRGKKLA